MGERAQREVMDSGRGQGRGRARPVSRKEVVPGSREAELGSNSFALLWEAAVSRARPEGAGSGSGGPAAAAAAAGPRRRGRELLGPVGGLGAGESEEAPAPRSVSVA